MTKQKVLVDLFTRAVIPTKESGKMIKLMEKVTTRVGMVNIISEFLTTIYNMGTEEK